MDRDFQHGKGLGLIWSRASNANAVRASKEILEELAGALILAVYNRPSAEGGISIYFMTGHRTVYIESYNQGLRHS